MIEPEQLLKYTHDVLTHLYDLPYLLQHPLAFSIATEGRTESPGRVLRRLLLDAIQELKPPAESPHDSVAAARYQFLYLRYLQGKPIDEMARLLGLSERQLYRRQRDALEAVAAILARELQLVRPSPPSGPDATAFSPAGTMSPEAEVDRIGLAAASQPVDLQDVLAGIRQTLTPLCQSTGREIILPTAAGPVLVTVERVALRQALLALLLFAIETSRSSAIQITVEIAEGWARLAVAIPTGGREPTLDEGNSNLTVCRRLVRLQGGELEVQRSPGPRIVITLPAFRRRSVLVVDDNSDARNLFSRYLDARGYRVVTAASGEQALEIARREHPDAIVLDVMLPSADGYEVLQTLASDPAVARTPIVVCTVLKQRELALALGATEFLAKPVSRGELLAALDRCWERHAPAHRW
jgi:CheY-like chemotaxis protein